MAQAGGADDLSRGNKQCLDQNLAISDAGWGYLKRNFPEQLHLVFGSINEGEKRDYIHYSSFHDEDDSQFSGCDPFATLMKGFHPSCLHGSFIILPPINLLDKTVELLEDMKTQQEALFLLIIPESKLQMIKWRLRNKDNLHVSKFQNKNKRTRLTIRTRQNFYLLRFGQKFELI